MVGRFGGWLWGRPYLLLCLTMLFWSGNIVFGRAVATSLPPATLAFLRWSGAFLVALPFALPWLKRDAALIRRSLPLLLVLAATGVALNNAIVYLGLRYTEATNALVLQSVSPLVIALWSYLLFRERLTGRQIAGLALSFAGVAAVLSRGVPESLLQLRPNPGDLFILAAILTYSLYVTLLRRRPAIHATSFIAVIFGLGTLMLVPFCAGELALGLPVRVDGTVLLAVLYVAIFPSLLAFIAFNRGVELIGPNRAGPFLHLMPPFGAILAIIFLGERPALFHGVGFALILAGIALAAAPRPSEPACGEVP